MYIRKATKADAAKIAYVHVKSWQTTYHGILPQKILDDLSYEQRTQQWTTNMENGNVYVAVDNAETIVGFSSGGHERTGKYLHYTGELYAIYILEEYQRQGIGRRLLKRVIEELKEDEMHSMLVWVLEHNASAYFYESLGATYLDKTGIQIAGDTYQENAYGWAKLP